MSASEILVNIRDWLGTDSWIVEVFVVVLVVVVANYSLTRMLDRLHARLTRTKTPWDDALVHALRKPLGVLVWIVGISFAAEIIYAQNETAIFQAVPSLRDVGVIATILWFLVRFIHESEQNIIKQRELRGKEIDRTSVQAIGKLLRLTIWITGALVILQTLGYSVSGVLAFGGIGGIAIGFAAKDLLANFFGGLMLYMDRPFVVGDWVRSPDKEIEGTVEDIGWRLTRIRTFDKRPLYVPNSVFANISVENPSRMTRRRIYETVGIRYNDANKMDAIINDVKQMLIDHPEIDDTQTMIVNFNKFAPSSLDFFIYTFTNTTDWVKFHGVKQDVMLKIIRIIEDHGAECAFPTSTLHVPDEVKLQLDQVATEPSSES